MPERGRDGVCLVLVQVRGWLSKAELFVAGGLVFHRVMAEEENLSTIPLLCLICRNDLSREEFQQLLHSTVPSACDRQGAAP